MKGEEKRRCQIGSQGESPYVVGGIKSETNGQRRKEE